MLMDEPMEPYIRKQRGDRDAAASLLRNKKIASERRSSNERVRRRPSTNERVAITIPIRVARETRLNTTAKTSTQHEWQCRRRQAPTGSRATGHHGHNSQPIPVDQFIFDKHEAVTAKYNHKTGKTTIIIQHRESDTNEQ
ncbi:unnamed protein product [Sphagnum balticum]